MPVNYFFCCNAAQFAQFGRSAGNWSQLAQLACDLLQCLQCARNARNVPQWLLAGCQVQQAAAMRPQCHRGGLPCNHCVENPGGMPAGRAQGPQGPQCTSNAAQWAHRGHTAGSPTHTIGTMRPCWAPSTCNASAMGRNAVAMGGHGVLCARNGAMRPQ